MNNSAPVWVSERADPQFDVVGLGENSLDRTVALEEFPTPGSKWPLAEMGQQAGGQVASALLGCARLGLQGAYLGVIGDDAAGQGALAPLRAEGLNLSGVTVCRGAHTRSALILVRQSDGERSVLEERDPALTYETGEEATLLIERSRLLLLDATDLEASLWAADVAERNGVPIVLDLDHVFPGVEALLERAQFPVVSDSFAEAWGGKGGLRSGLERMGSSPRCRLPVATCGADGAVARWQGAWLESPGFPVAASDTTGAGDAFRAGFIWALLNGETVDQVLRIANAVAALSCTATGAQAGLPRRLDLDVFLSSG